MKRFASITLGMVIFLGAIRTYVLYQDSAPTSVDAVSNYITRIALESNSPQRIESLNVVSSTPSNKEGDEQVLLFQANDRGLQAHIIGYAITQKSMFGWHVAKLQMTGKSPLPDDVIAGLDRSESISVVYGQVLLADVKSVQAVFNDPNQGELTISADIVQGSFAIFGTPHSELTLLKLIDINGNLLKQLSKDELQNG